MVKESITTSTIIIQTAYKLFMEHGYRAVSTRTIAQACGITQPALYHHFKNKQEIYIQVIKTSLLQTEQSLYKIINCHQTFKERITKVTHYFFSNYQENLEQMFHDIQHEFTQEKLTEVYSWWHKAFLQPIITIVEEAKRTNELKDLALFHADSSELSLLFLQYIKSTLTPIELQHLSETERMKKIEKKTNLMVSVFLYGVHSHMETN